MGCVLLCAAPACLLEDDRCGPNQELREGLCKCVVGAMLQANQCIIPDAGPPPPLSGLGSLCDDDKPCSDPAAPTCQLSPSGERYCTSQGCTTSADCTNSFVCDTSASPTYCRRPYTGQQTPCETDAQCAQFDAHFCSSTTLMVCLVKDCTDTSCDPGYMCFDPAEYGFAAPKVCISESTVPP